MPDGFLLSERDRQLLNDLIKWWRSQPNNGDITAPQNQHTNASEVYIAKVPAAGIPPLENVIGAADRPGSATCEIYRVQLTSPATLTPLHTTRKVYNISTSWVDSEYALIHKTKGGQWAVDCPCFEFTGTGTGTGSTGTGTTGTGTGTTGTGTPPTGTGTGTGSTGTGSTGTGTGSTGTGSTGTGSTGTGCCWTGSVYVLTGLVRRGDRICATRVKQTYECGVLCSVESASEVCVDFGDCCDDEIGTGEPAATGTSSNSCEQNGVCIYQWDGAEWQPFDTVSCETTPDCNCTCSPPDFDGTVIGEEAEGTCNCT